MPSITPTTRFISIRINASEQNSGGPANSLGYVLFWSSAIGQRPTQISLPFYGDPTSVELEDLAVLDEIYKSADGFLDAQGDPLTITVYGYDSFNQLVRQFYNPFDIEEHRAWVASRGNQALHIETSYTKDPVTGKITSNVEHDMIQGPRVPDGATYPYPLSRFHAGGLTSTRMTIDLHIDEQEKVTSDGLDTFVPVMAMLAWLRGNQLSTQTEATGADADADATYRQSPVSPATIGVVNEYAHTIGTETFALSYAAVETYQNISGYVYLFRIVFEHADTVSEEVADRFGAYFYSATIDLPVDGRRLQPTQKGNALEILHGRGLQAPGQIVEFVNGEIIQNILGRRNRTGASVGRIAYSDELQTLIDSGRTFRVLPLGGRDGMVRFDGLTANIDVLLDTPEQIIDNDSEYKTWFFENEDQARTVHFRDSQGKLIVNCYPGEAFSLVVSRGRQGRGRALFYNVPSRLFTHALIGGPLALSALPYWTDGEGARYYLISANHRSSNADTFEDGIIVSPAGDQGDFTAARLNGRQGGIKTRWPSAGIISLEAHATLDNLDTVTGSLSNGTGLQIWASRPGGSLELVQPNIIDLMIMGPGQWDFSAINSISARKDDVFFAFFKVAAASLIDETNTRLASLNFKGNMLPKITVP